MASARKLIARNIRHYREKLGITQEELAELSGVHRTYVGCIERAEKNVTIDTLDRVAKALKIPVHKLLVNGNRKGR